MERYRNHILIVTAKGWEVYETSKKYPINNDYHRVRRGYPKIGVFLSYAQAQRAVDTSIERKKN